MSKKLTTWPARTYYILRNKSSGKRYVGQHNSTMETYRGSGTKWINHCKKHGGYTVDNIEVIWSKWITEEDDAIDWLNKFSKENPNYWLNENNDWANQIPESHCTHLSPMTNLDSIEKMRQTKLKITESGVTRAYESSLKMAETRKSTIMPSGLTMSQEASMKAAKSASHKRDEINKKISVTKQRKLDNGLTVGQYAAIKAAETMKPNRREINQKLSEAKHKLLDNGLTSAQQGALNGAKIRSSAGWKNKNHSICQHCNKLVDPANYKRWHGDNCKYNR
jgi:hypothetical protein